MAAARDGCLRRLLPRRLRLRLLLLRRLRRLLPAALCRAYADDLAMVLRDGVGSASTLEAIFEEYAALAGLVLHHDKSVWLPLYHSSTEDHTPELQSPLVLSHALFR